MGFYSNILKINDGENVNILCYWDRAVPLYVSLGFELFYIFNFCLIHVVVMQH